MIFALTLNRTVRENLEQPPVILDPNNRLIRIIGRPPVESVRILCLDLLAVRPEDLDHQVDPNIVTRLQNDAFEDDALVGLVDATRRHLLSLCAEQVSQVVFIPVALAWCIPLHLVHVFGHDATILLTTVDGAAFRIGVKGHGVGAVGHLLGRDRDSMDVQRRIELGRGAIVLVDVRAPF